MARVASGFKVKLQGTEVPAGAVHSVLVEQDIDQPDMCAIQLNNTSGFAYSTSANLGDTLEVEIGMEGAESSAAAAAIFKGEVVGIEPIFDVEGESKVILRAFNRLHRLTRGRKSRTFQKMTDTDIAKKVGQDAGLTVETKGDVTIKYDHVYQHNQTDLEFLLLRAGRINYEIVVEDKKLFFRKRDTSQDSGIEFKWGELAADYCLQRFTPRLTTAGIVQEVNVHGWDPDQKKEVVGKATALANALGAKDGPAAANSPFGKVLHYDVDVPVRSTEEANALAKAKLEEVGMAYITGEAKCVGNPKLKPGIVVKLDCPDTRFKGKYYITGATHRYSQKTGQSGGGGEGGYTTILRVRRNAAES